MGITKYTNIEQINNRTQNEGERLQPEDLFVISKQGQTQDSEFGNCIYDTMEVSVYDINNVLLPQESGNTVAYIKGSDVKNYIYETKNALNIKELAINAEKLLNDIGFTNGILKININFVRNKIGSNNQYERLWIQEISPTRQEIRIVPLKSNNNQTNDELNNHLINLQNQNIEFFNYRNHVITQIDAQAVSIQQSIHDAIQHKYGKDIFAVLKKDFGISNFDTYSQKIFDDFKQSMIYYMTNKNYIISQSNYGKPSLERRFEDCEMYNSEIITDKFKQVLYDCIEYNTKAFVRKRVFQINTLPKSFDIVEIQKQIQDTLDTINTQTITVNRVFTPDNVDVKFDDAVIPTTPVVIEPTPIEVPVPIEIYPKEPTPLPPIIGTGDIGAPKVGDRRKTAIR